MANAEKTLVTLTVGAVALCMACIIFAIKGEKRIIKENFIRGSLGWPEVRGDKVPVAARRYKLMVIAFACIMAGSCVAATTYIIFKMTILFWISAFFFLLFIPFIIMSLVFNISLRK
ncbi:hypothetical protein KP005_20315 [Geomonas nitrogeniifigens]|uniref:DUF3784 domain-containing protein n=1 Tax=Geomonas diazotrophica TaxID=2843197 RepID=A0ABX8JGX7_9BACT|nr:hypothetical protein [Geomonas nitrogeniifigens]QWV97645.1 hypothetical protein KP005_20315 [Geomonas nitrogeniifigens]